MKASAITSRVPQTTISPMRTRVTVNFCANAVKKSTVARRTVFRRYLSPCSRARVPSSWAALASRACSAARWSHTSRVMVHPNRTMRAQSRARTLARG